MLVGREQPPRADMQAGNHAGEKDDPGGLDTPAVAPGEALDDRAAQLLGRQAVAEHAVAHARAERFQDRARRTEVGVGNPQRNDVTAGVAVPAQAPAAGALDRQVEIYFFWGFDSSSFSRLSCSSSGVAL